MGVSENRLVPLKTQYGFADHYPYISLLNGYFIGNIPNIFRHTHILLGNPTLLIHKPPEIASSVPQNPVFFCIFVCRAECPVSVLQALKNKLLLLGLEEASGSLIPTYASPMTMPQSLGRQFHDVSINVPIFFHQLGESHLLSIIGDNHGDTISP